MDPSSSDLEFFDFKNSSDEEIKEIQAILKGPGSNGCVELPWEISVRSDFPRSFPETEDAVLETGPATKSAKDIRNTTASQPSHFVPPQTPPSPVPQLPPSVETFVTLPTTVGPYQNAPYFVSRTIPYLRAYPPMGVPFFACPMAGEANPYGQFVPMVPEAAEPAPKSRDRQSGRRSSKKRLSGETDHSEAPSSSYPDGSQTSVPLVPLPPSTFVGGNLPMHGYPPGLHTLQAASSPTMYYVPVFNHPYGGYLSPSGPPSMMLPVNVAAELECVDRKELPQTDVDAIREDSPLENHSEDSGVVELANHQANYGGVEEERVLRNGRPEDSPRNDGSAEVLRADNACPEKSPRNDSDVSGETLRAAHSPVSLSEGTAPNVQSDCSLRLEDARPTAKIDVTQMEEATDSTDPSSGLPSEVCLEGKVSLNMCLEETASVSTETAESNVCPEGISIKGTVSAETRTTSSNDCRPVELVTRDPSRCWADLFKGPPRQVNGFEAPSHKRGFDGKSALSGGKRDNSIANGKMNSVPASNNFH